MLAHTWLVSVMLLPTPWSPADGVPALDFPQQHGRAAAQGSGTPPTLAMC